VLNEVEYRADGRLADDTGHVWRRVTDWVEPAEADRLVFDGTPFLVQLGQASPHRGRPERYQRDIRLSMLTWFEARRYQHKRELPTVMVGELWRSDDAGDCLLFVEHGPTPRSGEQLT
jgi:hypothetical protein